MQHLYMGRTDSALLPMCIVSSSCDSCHMPRRHERGSLSEDLLTYVKNLREEAGLSMYRQSIFRSESRAAIFTLTKSW